MNPNCLIEYALNEPVERCGPFGEQLLFEPGVYAGLLQIRAVENSLWASACESLALEVVFDFRDSSGLPWRWYGLVLPEELWLGEGDLTIRSPVVVRDRYDVTFRGSLYDRVPCVVRWENEARQYGPRAPAHALFSISSGQTGLDILVEWRAETGPDFKAERQIEYQDLILLETVSRGASQFRGYKGPESFIRLVRLLSLPSEMGALVCSPVTITAPED